MGTSIDDEYLELLLQPIYEFWKNDESITEILINRYDSIYIERGGRLEKTGVKFPSEESLRAAMENIAKSVGRTLDDRYPQLDARLSDPDSRVHAVIPPLARAGTVVSIRKFASKDPLTIDRLIGYGSIDPVGRELLETIVQMRRNIVVSGNTSSGKTSVLNILGCFMGERERVLVLEDASELKLQQEHIVPFETRPPDKDGNNQITMRDLVRSALRLRPDRLVIGEIRGGEALDMLQAMNTGHEGSMSTIHANSPFDCLSRLETCALQNDVAIPLHAVRSQVASAVQVVVHTSRYYDGRRRVTHIAEVLPLDNGCYHVEHLRVHKLLPERDEEGRPKEAFTGTGYVPTFFDDAKLAGLTIEEAWFEKA